MFPFLFLVILDVLMDQKWLSQVHMQCMKCNVLFNLKLIEILSLPFNAFVIITDAMIFVNFNFEVTSEKMMTLQCGVYIKNAIYYMRALGMIQQFI